MPYGNQNTGKPYAECPCCGKVAVGENEIRKKIIYIKRNR